MGIPLSKPITKDTDRGREGGIFVPDGQYLVRINAVELRERKDDEGNYVHAEYEILDAAKADGVSAIGLRIFDIFSLGEAAEWKICQWMDAAHAPDKFEGGEIPDTTEGKEMVVRAKNEVYKKRENLRVKEYANSFNWSGQTLKTNDAGEHIIASDGNAKAAEGTKQVSV